MLRSMQKALEAELTGGVEGEFDGVPMFVLLETCWNGRDGGQM